MRCPKPDEIRKAVDAYNDDPDCGAEDERCWVKTARARELVLGLSYSPDTPREIAAYAEEIRMWGSIQGVSRDDYPRAAVVLWKDPVRKRIRELKQHTIMTAPLNDVVGLEEALVQGMVGAGIPKTHYSWASKMLHFLLPATMPVYDSYVREYLETTQGIDAYRVIASRAKECAKELAPHEEKIVGTREPRTLLRAIDKFYWWEAYQSGKRRSTEE